MYNVYAMVCIESKYIFLICIRICLQMHQKQSNHLKQQNMQRMQQEHRCITHSTDVSLQV